MMENLLRPLIQQHKFIVRELDNENLGTDEQLQLLINMIQPYLYKMRGKYSLSPGIRSYVLRQVDSDFGADVCRQMIDAVLLELDQINSEY